MLFYFIACCNAIFSYDLARGFTTFNSRFAIFANHQLPINVEDIIWYGNILNLFIIPIFGLFLLKFKKINVFKFSFYIENKKLALCLFFPILAADCKSILSNKLSGSAIASYSVLTPFLVCIFAHILLKEVFPKNYKKAIIIALIGFFVTKIFTYTTASLESKILTFCLFGYVLINALSNITTRSISKQRKSIDGIFFEIILYAINGVVMFLIFDGFKPAYLLKWQIWVVALPSIMHHIFVILGNQRSKYFANIIYIDISKVVIATVSNYVFFRNVPTVTSLIGICIILYSFKYIYKK